MHKHFIETLKSCIKTELKTARPAANTGAIHSPIGEDGQQIFCVFHA